MTADTPPIKLYTALLAAQRAFGPLFKNTLNPHLKSKYADLGAVLDTIEQPLWDNGLIIVQRFASDQGNPILITELIHAESGQAISGAVPVVSKDATDPQKIGAAITYYRRYSLLALLGLAPEDDDGHSASQPAPRRDQQPATRPAPPARTTPPAAQPVEADQTANLLGRIRDDTAQPEFRRKALHTYYLMADSLDDLDRRAAAVAESGLPAEDLRKGYDYHAKRFTVALALPASYSG